MVIINGKFFSIGVDWQAQYPALKLGAGKLYKQTIQANCASKLYKQTVQANCICKQYNCSSRCFLYFTFGLWLINQARIES